MLLLSSALLMQLLLQHMLLLLLNLLSLLLNLLLLLLYLWNVNNKMSQLASSSTAVTAYPLA